MNSMVNSVPGNFEKANGPELQYVVVNKNSIILNRSIGLTNIDKRIPVISDHTMAAFSMNNTLTAIAILQFVKRDEVPISQRERY
jgi:hypothetical protein